MNRNQRKFTAMWIGLGAVVLLLVMLDDFVATHASWLRWIAFVGVIIAAARESYSRSETEAEGRERIADVIASAPWLKVWFSMCAAAAVTLAIYVTRNSIDIVQLVGFKYLVIALVVVLGPLVFIMERERFSELGK